MKRPIELLAPGGDIDAIKAAIAAGADAIYCGLDKFNARDRATNIDFQELHGIVHLAHQHNCQVFLTLNIIILENEIPALVRLLNKLVNTKIDAVIVQDLGVFYLLSKYFRSLKVHASTQVNTHNTGQIEFLNRLNADRFNLSRELNIHEIKELATFGHSRNISTEVFVHGSYCLSFSGLCYISSVLAGRSGNRGRCSQPCRDRYERTSQGKEYPLNLKDNSAYFDVKELSDAGVDSLKIEGRIKKFDYVFTVVNCWKKQLQGFSEQGQLSTDNSDLSKVFNRDFSNGFLKGDINKEMFIDNPRDHSIKQLSEVDNYATIEAMDKNRIRFYEEKADTSARAKDEISRLSTAKPPLTLTMSGELGAPLSVTVSTPDTSFTVTSDMSLARAGKKSAANHLSRSAFFEKFKAVNDTEYVLKDIDVGLLQPGLFISYKELTSIKKRVLFILHGSKEIIAPIEVPAVKKQPALNVPPTLSVLVSSKEDVTLCNKTSATLFFLLPSSLKHDRSELIDLFQSNRALVPWFPSVLIGEDFTAAVEFLETVQPKRIVTNNTGIAYEAFNRGIPWIAGPYLNSVNSFSLLCLKEKFNCQGAFISNELSKKQIRSITRPENFDLYYSIYHPISLITSRQCLHHQVIGCEKSSMDETCMRTCNKSSTVTHASHAPLCINKAKGHYPCIYNGTNYLNTDIVTDLPNMFSHVTIDLREIRTDTTVEVSKPEVITLFQSLLTGTPDSEEQLTQAIHPTTHGQYQKGI
ncbi:peptidase U32 [Desulfoluna limicola]|uniref:Peptidase U32 n=1 Tax=Desulfoluna limicola TaxID=2810562 RepID=A0ABM7PC85_9BACT|nr:U32 family peptidase [Desulfoluna limicola]BCS94810.1 peptidase U32 [Desulfoluna limicola]